VGVAELDVVGEGAAGVADAGEADADGEGLGVEERCPLGEVVGRGRLVVLRVCFGFFSRALRVLSSAGVVRPLVAPAPE
jgi:hypothetical protein